MKYIGEVKIIYILFFITDVEEELECIQSEKPFWGTGQPRCWWTFMVFGYGKKVVNPQAEPSIWTLTAPSTKKRGGSRNKQRKMTMNKIARSRAQADAEYRSKNMPTNPLIGLHQQLVGQFSNFMSTWCQRSQ